MKTECKCNTPEAGPVGNISFKVEGFDFTAFKRGGECAYCVEERYRMLLKKYGSKIFKSGAHFDEAVDWNYFIDCERNHDEWNSTFPEVFDLLDALGVFSNSEQGNWEIVYHGGLNLNPSPFCGPVYFTQKKNVLEYAKLKYGSTVYSWSVRCIGEVISKNTVLETA